MIELISFQFINLDLEFGLEIPIFSLDSCTTKSKHMNDLSIVKCKSSDSNFDGTFTFFIKAKTWKFCKALFHLILNPALEARYYRRGRCIKRANPSIVHFLDVVLEEIYWNIELNGKVTGSDGFDIPFDIVVFLNFLNVVKDIDHKESNEDRGAA